MPHRKTKVKPKPKPKKTADAGAAATKSTARAKRVAPAASTGGAGNSFESRVQAHRLLAMCTSSTSCPGIPEGFKIVAIRFQTRVFGCNTDDLTCIIEDGYGKKGSVRLQMKRTLQATVADTSFKEAVGLAWLDFKSPTFRVGADFFNVIYDVVSAQDMKAVSDIARDAARSLNADSWELKATAANFSNNARRSALKALRSIVEDYNKAPVPKDELFGFIQHMQFLHEDLDSDETAGAKLLQYTIEFATRVPGRPALPPSAVWAKLIAVCVDLNGCAGEVDLMTVGARLGSDLDYRFKAFAMGPSLAIPQAPVMADDCLGALPHVSVTPAEAPGGATLSAATDLIPASRDSSANKLVSRMLDRVSELIKAYKFKDAKEELQRIRQDTEDQTLDSHQKARWYSMHGSCVLAVDGDEQAAADDFIKAADLYEDDDKLAAARIRGLLLKSNVPEAVAAAHKALKRFPNSLAVWVSSMNTRLVSGEKVTEADIPAAHADKSVAYQLVSVALHRAGDAEGALEVAFKGLQKEDASFFTRDTVLRYALELATTSPVYVAYRVGPAPRLAALRRAVDEFSPRETKLWSAQVPETLTAAAMHLSYAHLVLGEPSEALQVTQEAMKHHVDQKALIRPRLEALRDLDRPGEALAFGVSLLDTMPLDALVSFAQTAANEEDIERLALAAAAGGARANEDKSGRLPETLRVMHWEMLLRQDKAQDVVREVTEQSVLTSDRVPLLVLGARAFLQHVDATSAKAANEYIARAVHAAQSDNDPANDYLVAQLMMQAKRYSEAAERYENIVPAGGLSELHTNLLICYIRLGLRAKARELIGSFPEHWRKNRLARHLAMELGQQAGDWQLLQTLVDPQLEDEGHLAKSWLFALMVAAHTAPASIDELASKLPRVLEGTIREVTQAASAEFQHNQLDKGLARLYRMRRRNMDSTDAAAALHMAVVLSPVRLEHLHTEPEGVGIGTSVQVADAAGVLRWTTVDPAGFDDLPATEEFIRAEAPEAKALFGKKAGDKFIVTDSLGGQHPFTVTAVVNAYTRLMMLSTAALHAPIAPSEHLTSLQLPTKADGELDVGPVLRQLQKKEASSNRLFTHYQDQALTLGMLARVLGTDTLDLVRAWPDEGPLLQVGGGEGAERARADARLRSGKRLLVDLSALTELALVKQLHLLQATQRPLVTAASRDAVLQKLAEARILKPMGTAMSRGGRFHLIEHTDESRARDQAFLQCILDAIAQYCEVVPAYGPPILPVQIPQLATVVALEEHALLMVALEYDALFLTLDMRMRGLASVFQVQSCWPQVFLSFKVGPELSLRDYSIAVLQMFCSRRDFICLNVHDLLVLTDQGDQWINIGFTRLREQLATASCDFTKGWSVIRQYLEKLYGRGECEFGAALEFFMYLLEGLLRHPHCPTNFATVAAVQLGMTLDSEKDAFTPRLKEFSQMAVARLKLPLQPVTVRAKVFYCCQPPAVRHGLSDVPDHSQESSKRAAIQAEARQTETTLNRPTEEE
jgi:tetratricopeptide (TPR) repeat protein